MISNVKGHFTKFEGQILTAEDPLEFTATGEINRMDFGVSHNGPAPGGGVLLGERVQIILEIEAFLQAAD